MFWSGRWTDTASSPTCKSRDAKSVGDGDGEGLVPSNGLVDGDGFVLGLGLTPGLGETVGDPEGVGLGLLVGVELGLMVGVGLALVLGVDVGLELVLGDGVGEPPLAVIVTATVDVGAAKISSGSPPPDGFVTTFESVVELTSIYL